MKLMICNSTNLCMHTVSDNDVLYIENDIYRTINCIYASRTLSNTVVVTDVLNLPQDYLDCKYKYINNSWHLRDDWVDTSSLSESEIRELVSREFAND